MDVFENNGEIYIQSAASGQDRCCGSDHFP